MDSIFSGPNLIIAGPGTGKTTFLINKIEKKDQEKIIIRLISKLLNNLSLISLSLILR